MNRYPEVWAKDPIWSMAMGDRIMSCIKTRAQALLADEDLGKAAEFFGYKWKLLMEKGNKT